MCSLTTTEVEDKINSSSNRHFGYTEYISWHHVDRVDWIHILEDYELWPSRLDAYTWRLWVVTKSYDVWPINSFVSFIDYFQCFFHTEASCNVVICFVNRAAKLLKILLFHCWGVYSSVPYLAFSSFFMVLMIMITCFDLLRRKRVKIKVKDVFEKCAVEMKISSIFMCFNV